MLKLVTKVPRKQDGGIMVSIPKIHLNMHFIVIDLVRSSILFFEVGNVLNKLYT